MKKRVGFMVYNDWREVLNDFDDKLYRELMEAIFDLGFNNEETATSPLVKVAMKLIRPQILRDWEKYEERIKRNKINGLQGGRPKTQNNPENPVGSEKTQKTQSVISVPEKPSGGQEIKNKKEEIKNEKEEYLLLEPEGSLSAGADSEKKVDYIEIVNFYNKAAYGSNIVACVKLTDKRKAAIRARVKEYGKEQVFEAITRAARSTFCNGHNEKNWKADFDFVFNANKMARILEGKYDTIGYGNSGNSNEQSIRSVGEQVLGDIFAEIEERRRTEGAAD